jgi:hypothetical protein
MTLQDQIENYRIHFGAEMPVEKAQQVIEQWRSAAAAKTDGQTIELAAPFQRHYTNFGTGLPPNFCLALTADEVLAFKFDPRNPQHPLSVNPRQVRKQVASWPRDAVRAGQVEPGRLTFNVTLEITEAGGAKRIPCRTPRLSVNPAAGTVIVALGGELAKGG